MAAAGGGSGYRVAVVEEFFIKASQLPKAAPLVIATILTLNKLAAAISVAVARITLM